RISLRLKPGGMGMQAGGGGCVGDRLTCRNSECVGRFRVSERPVFYVQEDPKMVKICRIDGCEKPVNAKGVCAMHYARQRRKKAPTVSKAEGRLEELVAMRAVMAKALDAEDTPARKLPALVRRMIECSELIESLEERERDARAAEERAGSGAAAFRLEAI